MICDIDCFQVWIYHNSTLWLISLSSDWTNWFTISDKNLGATTFYNDGDTLSEANCGYYYQWGNCYWFAFSWTLSVSTSTVNAQNYWPWNYYTNSTWRNVVPRDSSQNPNLWWWTTGTVEAMQWPCPSGYHIPNDTDRQSLRSIWVTNWAWTLSDWNNFGLYLLLPRVWMRDNDGSTIISRGSIWYYWSSNIWSSWSYWHNMSFSDTYIWSGSSNFQTRYGSNIRPFANTPVAFQNIPALPNVHCITVRVLSGSIYKL